jgi:phosphopantetheinyl transferase
MYSISNNEIHVWNNKLFSVDLNYSILTHQELYYAEKYPTTSQKKKYFYTRALLKQILSLYVGIPANEITFENNASGKPYLCNKKNLYFNLSHTNTQFCLAIGCTDEIGIDIEAHPESHTMEEIIDYFLTDEEKTNVLNNYADADLELNLLRMWTQKEAITKALGYTLESSLKHINLSPQEKEFIFTYNDTDIHVKEFIRDNKVIGTLATKHPISSLKKFGQDDTDSIISLLVGSKSSERTSWPIA